MLSRLILAESDRGGCRRQKQRNPRFPSRQTLRSGPERLRIPWRQDAPVGAFALVATPRLHRLWFGLPDVRNLLEEPDDSGRHRVGAGKSESFLADRPEKGSASSST